MKKPRSDSKLKTLPESRQVAIVEYASNHSLDQTVKWLLDGGLQTSCSALSVFLEARRELELQSKVLTSISSAAEQCLEVEQAFAKNPAPAVETLIKLHRVLTFQLTKHAAADPELLTLADKFTKTMLGAFATQNNAGVDGQKLALEERRVSLLEKKAALAEATEKVVTDRDLSPEERAQRIKEIYGRV